MSVVAIKTAVPVTLDELAREIGEQHRMVQQSVAASLEHAIRAGDFLLMAKAQVPFGEWDKWLAGCALEWGMTIEWARSYMRLARYQEEIREAKLPSFKAARRYLRVANVKDVRHDPVLRKEARRLRKDGLLQREIAVELGVSQPTVGRWLNPAMEKKYRAERAKTSRAGRSAIRRKERDKAAKVVGGELAEGYTLLRRCLDVLERAAAEHSGEARREIRSAMNSLYNAEDAVSKAVKLATVEARP